jgi:uncharacterized protein
LPREWDEAVLADGRKCNTISEKLAGFRLLNCYQDCLGPAQYRQSRNADRARGYLLVHRFQGGLPALHALSLHFLRLGSLDRLGCLAVTAYILLDKDLFWKSYGPVRGARKAMHNQEQAHYKFVWQDLGDIEAGRPNLGPQVPVLAYRLLQYTLRDVLSAELGVDGANAILVKAGRHAGVQFCENLLNRSLGFNEFIAQLQQVLKDQAIGILRVENVDLANMRFTLTVAEDLDCSGLPCTDEVVCRYDEGFIAGLLEAYTGKPFQAKEVDCWASGDRVCRFDVRAVQGNR